MAETETFFVKVCEARNIESKKGGELYVRLKASTGFAARTQSSCDASPKWGEEFSFSAPKPKKKGDRTLEVKLVEKGHITDDTVAQTTINLDNLSGESDTWVTLEKKKGKGDIHLVLRLVGSGGDDKQMLESKYQVGKEIGRGGFSVVQEGTEKSTGRKVAIKIIDKKKQDVDQLKLLEREIDIMKKLSHPNIVQLYEVFYTSTNIYLVLEFVSGGELYDQIVARGSFTESDASGIVKQVLSATAHMHQHGIAHRDLKPENLLLSSVKGDEVKVADFGLSKDVSNATHMSTCCGSPSYVAPEVLQGGVYTHQCDVWSIGVILYVLLSGYLPFYGDTQEELFDKILSGTYSFSHKCWDDISPEAKDLLAKMLTVNVSQRITVDGCLNHAWLNQAGKARTTQLQSLVSLRDLKSKKK